MAIEAGDFKTGLTLEIDGNIYQVLDFQHVKPGKGAAILKTKLKNLRTGGIIERNFISSTKFEPATIDKRDVQFSYDSDGTYNFMDLETFEMYEINEELIGDQKNYLYEGLEGKLRIYEGEYLGVEIPEKVVLEVTDTTDAIAGNTASNATKDAYVQTGLLIKVPLFVKIGDKVYINTNTGKYDGRAN